MARLILFLVSLFYITMGMVVYHRAPDRVWNRIFAVHALAVSGWVFLNYLIQASTSLPEAEIWLRRSRRISNGPSLVKLKPRAGSSSLALAMPTFLFSIVPE